MMKLETLFKPSLLSIVFVLYACPGEELSFDNRQAIIPNLAKIEPVKEVYNLGEEIIYSVIIPSYYEQFGNIVDPVNLFQETGVNETMFGGSEIHKFAENQIILLARKNLIIENTLIAHLQYYPNENEYRYTAKIKFTQPGVYNLEGLGSLIIDFQNKNKGFNYGISTNLIGVNGNDNLIIRVQ